MHYMFTLLVALTLSPLAVLAEPSSTPLTPQEVKDQTEEVDKSINQTEELIKNMEKLLKKLDERETQDKDVEKLGKEIASRTSITGGSGLGEFGFGIGFGVLLLNGEGDTRSATQDNGVVLITSQEKQKLGLWFTTSWVSDVWPKPKINFGPFFGVQLGGSDDIVNSFALGLDFSFKKIKPELPLDFQFGWAWSKVKTLANGYIEGQPLPSGSSQVLLKDVVKSGPVLIASYNF